MLMPLGFIHGKPCVRISMVDVITIAADGIATIVRCNLYGRCYCQGGIDGIAT